MTSTAANCVSRSPILIDPAVLFSIRNETADQHVIEIFCADKSVWTAEVAEQAYQLVKAAAENGSALAMCLCSRFHGAGWGRPVSTVTAFEWAKQSADTGFPPGCFELGNCYENGIGVPCDLEQARYLYVLAVEGGFGFAACHLANLYHSGRFGQRDTHLALHYANLGYQLKDAMAPLLIATWFENGDGVIRNESEAVLWYTRAAELGNFFASNRLNNAYTSGELGLPRDPKLAQRFESMFNAQLPHT